MIQEILKNLRDPSRTLDQKELDRIEAANLIEALTVQAQHDRKIVQEANNFFERLGA